MVPNGFGHITSTRDKLKTFCIVPYLVQCRVIFLTKNSVALIYRCVLSEVRYSVQVPISCLNFREEQGVRCRYGEIVLVL